MHAWPRRLALVAHPRAGRVQLSSPGSDGPCALVDPGVCAGSAGTYHAQPIVVDGETRYFYLHVPPQVAAGPVPLLFDYHGTGLVDTLPEEEWGEGELTAVADTLGFIVVRPRSHSYEDDGQVYYQWDLDPGDLSTTLDLTGQLVAFLEAHYAIDPARVYVSGFSNGTNMALQTLPMSPNPFHGFGIVGGGIYYPFSIAAWPDPAPRIYATAGYRDLNYEFQRDMQTWLAAHEYPSDGLWIRQTKAIHELRGWQYAEMFGWIDGGTQPPVGTRSHPGGRPSRSRRPPRRSSPPRATARATSSRPARTARSGRAVARAGPRRASRATCRC